MEKVFTLLWVLIAIGAFVVRMVKKMRDTAAREAQERPNRPAIPALPTTTFAELLKQMQARNAAEPAALPAPGLSRLPQLPAKSGPRTPAGRPVPLEIARPARSQERTTIRPKSQEKLPVVALPATALPRASHEAPMEDYWQQRTRLQAQTAAQPKARVAHDVRQLLARPEGLRAAFVLSEILQRRHF